MPHPLLLQAAPAGESAASPADAALRVAHFLAEYWPILLPPVLGMAAVYWLLPRARRARPLYGALAGGLALAAALVFLWQWGADAVWPEKVLFYAFSAVALTGGFLLVTQHNPVYAALSFALVVLSTCGLFLLQGAPFLTAATIIIYAGAIVVTFLFVIMLAQQEGWSSADLRSREPFLATLAGMVLTAALLCVLVGAYRRPQLADAYATAASLERLARAESAEDVYAVMGRPEKLPVGGGATNKFVDDLSTRHFPDRKADLAAPHYNLEAQWRSLTLEPRAKHLQDLRRTAGEVLVQLQEKYRLSGLGAAPPGRVPPAEPRVRPELPARNVAALGQTMFTDYLLPVEVAALLLLVATIGAIAIAGRHSEVLR